MAKTFTIKVESDELAAKLEALVKAPGLEYILKRGEYDYSYRKARAAGMRADAAKWKALTDEQKARIIKEMSK